MKVWRLARAAYTTPNGEGAKKYGGRWTPSGLAAVYTSASLALAAVEALVHVDSDLLPDDLVILSAHIPETLPIRTISLADLPGDWQKMPAPHTLLTIGADWVRTNREVGLRVPSAVIPQEWNLLLNPAHPDFLAIEWTNEGRFHWDARLERHVTRESPGSHHSPIPFSQTACRGVPHVSRVATACGDVSFASPNLEDCVRSSGRCARGSCMRQKLAEAGMALYGTTCRSTGEPERQWRSATTPMDRRRS